MRQVAKYLAAACCMVSMAACSHGPSDSEVENAMKARVNDMGSSGETEIKVTSAKNSHCTSIESGSAYTCAVEIEMDLPMGAHMKSVAQLKMIKSNGVWTYDKNQVLSMQPSNSQ
jgi:hypothetical protein